MYSAASYVAAMSGRRITLPNLPEQKDRLKWAREHAEIKTPTEAAQRYGWNLNTYRSNENGNRAFGRKAARKYGEAFKVPPEWLLDGNVGGPEVFISHSSNDLKEIRAMLTEILSRLPDEPKR